MLDQTAVRARCVGVVSKLWATDIYEIILILTKLNGLEQIETGSIAVKTEPDFFTFWCVTEDKRVGTDFKIIIK